MNQDPWYDFDDPGDGTLNPHKAWRQKAANDFLKKALQQDAQGNYPFRDSVLKDEKTARNEFEKCYQQYSDNQIGLPPKVRVICVDPNLNNYDYGRAALVVFCLPTLPGPTVKNPMPPNWRKAWLAAWQPYGPKA